MEQVFLNIINNALAAMDSGGTLIVSAERSGEMVSVVFSDTGCGIPPENMDKIFEPFFTTRKVGEGTGLGLAMVHGAVEQSGGRIEVYSEPGQGTTFRVILPCNELDPSGPIEGIEAADLRGTETLLVVEDDEVLRGALGRSFRRRAGNRVCA